MATADTNRHLGILPSRRPVSTVMESPSSPVDTPSSAGYFSDFAFSHRPQRHDTDTSVESCPKSSSPPPRAAPLPESLLLALAKDDSSHLGMSTRPPLTSRLSSASATPSSSPDLINRPTPRRRELAHDGPTSPSSWKLEFRGMAQLVRRVSGRKDKVLSGQAQRSKTPEIEKPTIGEEQPPSTRHPLIRRLSYKFSSSSSKSKRSFAKDDQHVDATALMDVGDDRSPLPTPPLSRGPSFRLPFLLLATNPIRKSPIDNHGAFRPANVSQSDVGHSRSMSEDSENDTAFPTDVHSASLSGHGGAEPTNRPSIPRTQSSGSVTRRIKRVLSIAHLPSSSSSSSESRLPFNGMQVDSSPEPEDEKTIALPPRPRARKLSKRPNPDRSSARFSVASSSTAASSQTSNSSRKLTKRRVDFHRADPCTTPNARPSILCTLPELLPSAPISVDAVIRPRPKFELGGEEDASDRVLRERVNGRDGPLQSDAGGRTHILGDFRRSESPIQHPTDIAWTGHRPKFLHQPSTGTHRRWTVAVSEIPDDGDFLKELDRQLARGQGSSREASDSPSEDPLGLGATEDGRWTVARKAMLCVREIVRTEKSYQNHLIRISEDEATKALFSPPLFLSHLPALISASKCLTDGMEDDPSAWGVSAAFLGAEDALESALVAWSVVVGDVMSSDAELTPPPRSMSVHSFRRVATMSEDGHGGPAVKKEKSNSALYWRRGSTSSLGAGTPSPSASMAGLGVPGMRLLTLKDVAIMPTQRVGRYVMLYRDLLKLTPSTSPSRPLVERALQGALRIARRCDDAQQNTSFTLPHV